MEFLFPRARRTLPWSRASSGTGGGPGRLKNLQALEKLHERSRNTNVLVAFFSLPSCGEGEREGGSRKHGAKEPLTPTLSPQERGEGARGNDPGLNALNPKTG